MSTLEIDAGTIAISCRNLEIQDDGFGRVRVLVDGKELPGIVGVEVDIGKGRATFIRLQVQPRGTD
jgi:hypothetical protein